MKKTLFSLAFVVASAIYVAAANHLFWLFGAEPPDRDLGLAENAVGEIQGAFSIAEAPKSDVASDARSPIEQPMPSVLQPPAPAAPPRVSASTRPADNPKTAVAVYGSPGYRDGTYTGSSESAYYGHVQVRVTIASHKIASVSVLDYPQDRRTSRYINSHALPALKHEVIAANGASVDTVTGATLTSEAYLRSLSNALHEARG